MLPEHIKITALYLFVGLMVPIVFLFNAFVVPEPYSHPLINIAVAPTHLMPFLENKELLRELTQIVFGRQTANFARGTRGTGSGLAF